MSPLVQAALITGGATVLAAVIGAATATWLNGRQKRPPGGATPEAQAEERN